MKLNGKLLHTQNLPRLCSCRGTTTRRKGRLEKKKSLTVLKRRKLKKEVTHRPKKKKTKKKKKRSLTVLRRRKLKKKVTHSPKKKTTEKRTGKRKRSLTVLLQHTCLQHSQQDSEKHVQLHGKRSLSTSSPGCLDLAK